MVDILTKPLECAAAWRARDMARSTEWQYHLSADEIGELEAALAAAKASGKSIPALGRDQFPLGRFAETLQELLKEVESGRGFVLIRGLPVERYSQADAELMFWGVGSHLGRPAAQNARGELLGHVRDEGRDWDKDYTARGYQTTSKLPFHNDSADVVGLLCFRKAKAGGLSCIVSSTAVHNAMLERRPDLARVLYEPYYVDCRDEQPPGEPPFYQVPRFNLHKGRLFVQYSRVYNESAQRFSERHRMTPQQIEALDLFDELAMSDEFRLDMSFEPGDMQFISNHTILHSRTDYEDYDEPDRKRHLFRLWLFTPGCSDRPPAFERRYSDVAYWQAHPRA